MFIQLLQKVKGAGTMNLPSYQTRQTKTLAVLQCTDTGQRIGYTPLLSKSNTKKHCKWCRRLSGWMQFWGSCTQISTDEGGIGNHKPMNQTDTMPGVISIDCKYLHKEHCTVDDTEQYEYLDIPRDRASMAPGPDSVLNNLASLIDHPKCGTYLLYEISSCVAGLVNSIQAA